MTDKDDNNNPVVGLISITNTELLPGKFVDIKPPNGLAYVVTVGVTSGTEGGTFVSLIDSAGGLDIFNAPAGGNNASQTVVSSSQSWVRINNVDERSSAVYVAGGIVLKIG